MDDKRPDGTGSARNPAARKDAILMALSAHLSKLLYLDPADLDPHRPLLEMGVDSIFLVESLRTIEKEFGLRIAVRQVFEELTTLDALAAFIDEKLPVPAPAAEALREKREDPHGAGASASLAAAAGPACAVDGAAPLLSVHTAQVHEAIAAAAQGLQPGAILHDVLIRQLDVLKEQLKLLQADPGIPVSEPIATPRAAPAAVDAAALPPWRRAPAATPAFTGAQQQYLESFTRRFTERTRTSKTLAQAWRPVLADNRASAGFRFSVKELVYPIVGQRASGARIWDIDGNEYVDITMGFGVHLFGHRPPFIVAALKKQLDEGAALGPQSALAGEVAAAIQRLTGMERVLFCNTGTEAVMTAMRLARAVTGRERIALFSGSYHGHSDGTLVTASGAEAEASPLVPGVTRRMAADVMVLDYGNPESLEHVRRHAADLAAVLVEPVQSRRPDLQPREFLVRLREITRESGVALIFDEMITGFRIHPGGAQAFFGIEADLATYGKVIGGGMPIGVVAGRAAYLDAIDGGQWSYGDATYPGVETTFVAGTFSKHPLAMVAAREALAHLEANRADLEALNRRTAELAGTLNAYFTEQAVPMHVAHFGSLFRFEFRQNLDLFFYLLLSKGVYVWEGRNCFLSTAHGDEELEFIVRSVQDAVQELRAQGFLPAPADVRGSPQRSEPSRPAESRPDQDRLARSHGFWDRKKVRTSARAAESGARSAHRSRRPAEFSLFYFGNYPAAFSPRKYDALLEGARFADTHGFSAVWVPERHFHPFGGLSPNPSVLCASLAGVTSRIHLRAGSVVLPLHHPIRVAEEWAVVDNLSKGRVGIAFASGWHPDDFVFAPQSFGKQREVMFDGIETVQRLWRGESVRVTGGAGQEHDIGLFPMPMQAELPTWITIVNNPDTYRRAAALGAGVLTNLMDQSIEELAANISIYREALADHGRDTAMGHVTVLVHTFLDDDATLAREKARGPFCEYLDSTLGLFGKLVRRQGLDIQIDSLTAEDRAFVLAAAYDRYVATSALIGSPDSCSPIVEQLLAAGVDEIACFVDFGLDTESLVRGLHQVNVLRRSFAHEPVALPASPTPVPADESPSQDALFPLTEAQEHLWVLAALGGDAALTYNMHVSLKLKGCLDRDALAWSIQKVVDRHEALRTRFQADGSRQYVGPALKVDLHVTDLATGDQLRDSAVATWFAREARRPFDLVGGPVCRFSLLRLEEELHLLVLSIHHIIVDGWSIGVIGKELGEFYGAARRSEELSLPAPLQYREYIAWQQKQRASEETTRHEAYWLEQCSGPLPVLNLPSDHPRPALITFRGGRRTTQIDPDLRADLHALATRNHCTLYMVLLAAFAALLHRLSRQDDLVVSVPLADRSLEGSESLVGYCANQLPIRSRLSGDPTFREFLAQVRALLLDAYEHQDYPYARLLNRLLARRESSVLSPLHAVIFNLNPPVAAPQMGDLQIEWFSEHINWVADELAVHLTEMDGRVSVDCDYNSALFEASTVDRMLASYVTLLRAVVDDAGLSVRSLPLLTQEQRQQLLVEWNDTAVDFPRDTVPGMVAQQALRTPHALAAVFPGTGPEHDRRLTYRELEAAAGTVARRLRASGAGPGTLVGVCADRSLELLVGLLGVLKSGAAYVPLDPTYPEDRLAYMRDDSQLAILLLGPGQNSKLALPGVPVLPIVWEPTEVATAEDGLDAPLYVPSMPDDTAYVIYTSGSTGRPKGVVVTHGALSNVLHSMAREPGLTDQDVFLSVTSACFDIAALELYLPLTVGARVVIAPRAVTADGPRLRELIRSSGATVMQATPSTWKLLLSAGLDAPGLTALCGGEALPRTLADRLAESVGALHNLYGPTETTIWSTLFKFAPPAPASDKGGAVVSIGRPIANTRVYVLDEQQRPLAIGMPGELCIGGAGVAGGYHGQPALTAERFVPDPFGADGAGRLYRTGDLVRFERDGTLSFLGRLDTQIKIRGFRVELGEIEAALAQHPAIRETVVVARPERDEMRLVAYVVATSPEGAPSGDELRRWLRASLPNYMVPTAFVGLEALPLTANRKIDRDALPAPPSLTRRDPIVEPRDGLERELQAMWEDVLNVRPVGIRDDFFQLGGHSFLAVRLLARIQQRYGKELPLATLFADATIERTAGHLRETPSHVVRAGASRLILLQPQGDLPPFFCVHPAGGHVACYIDLARHLGPTRPFYALQFLGGSGERPATVEDLASCYVAELLTAQPHGPYQLGGWSIGGVIAFEMAQQLSRLGAEVRLLALIDTLAPVALDLPEEMEDVEVFGRLATDLAPLFRVALPIPLEGLRMLGREERERRFMDLARWARIVPPDTVIDEFRGTLRSFRQHLTAFSRYRPSPYAGRVTLFSARHPIAPGHLSTSADGRGSAYRKLLEVAQDARHGWSAWADDIETIEVPGDHYSIVREPVVRDIAEALRARLVTPARTAPAAPAVASNSASSSGG